MFVTFMLFPVQPRGEKMKKLLQLITMGLVVVFATSLPTLSSAATLTGRVMLNHRAASAAVIAVPYNPQTHETIGREAVVVPTDATGRFHLTVRSTNYLLVAWDGQNGVVVDSPTASVTLNMTDQTPPSYRVATDCGWKCSCHHLFGNLYVVWLSSNSIACGSYQYLSWGCRC